MKKKAKLVATLSITLIVSGLAYSKAASAACIIFSGVQYCF